MQSSQYFVGKYPIFVDSITTENQEKAFKWFASDPEILLFLRLKHTILLNTCILFSATYTDQNTRNSRKNPSIIASAPEIFVLSRRKHAILLIVMLVNSIFVSTITTNSRKCYKLLQVREENFVFLRLKHTILFYYFIGKCPCVRNTRDMFSFMTIYSDQKIRNSRKTHILLRASGASEPEILVLLRRNI